MSPCLSNPSPPKDGRGYWDSECRAHRLFIPCCLPNAMEVNIIWRAGGRRVTLGLALWLVFFLRNAGVRRLGRWPPPRGIPFGGPIVLEEKKKKKNTLKSARFKVHARLRLLRISNCCPRLSLLRLPGRSGSPVRESHQEEIEPQ